MTVVAELADKSVAVEEEEFCGADDARLWVL